MAESGAFSICAGGRLHRAMQRAGLARHSVGLALVLALGWVPILVLATLDGTLKGGADHQLLRDPAPWIRFLIAAPIAVFGERYVDRLLGVIVGGFRNSHLLRQADQPAFDAALDRAQRWATSDTVELLLLALALTLPHLAVASAPRLMDSTAWFGAVVGGEIEFSRAGHWYAWVSLPLIEFLLLRWLWRIAAWWGFLWRVSRLDLAYTPAHPDRAAGLGFLGLSPRAFLPICFCFSVLAAAGIAKQIGYGGASLADARVPIVALLLCECVILLAPQFFFFPKLVKVRSLALLRYGLVATGMTRTFEEKWIGAGGDKGADLVGSSEPSAMIDYAGTYGLVLAMQPLGITVRQLASLVLPLAAPFAPLLLFQYSVKDILKQLLEVLR